ncbi:glycosyltransferase family 4 protein [Psychrobacter faecalis]|uniref:glycosyltransferase family 4 protein n=1 Tax=Psychrobacter faecalis TaxID=180588 RepID=UPI003FD46742
MIILHLIKTTVGATWALREIQVLIRLGCEVHVALPDRKGLYEDYKTAGAHVHIVNVDIASFKTSPLAFTKAVIDFRKLVLEINPNIIHSHFVGTTYFMRMALTGIPIKRIFQVPGPLHLEKTITRKVDVNLANKYDYWIPTCHLSEQYYLQEGIAKDRLTTIFYGSDVSVFNNNQPKGSLRRELNIPDGIKIVGMVAFVYPPKKWLGQSRGLKGHEDLIDAMSTVIKQRKNVVCVIVGGAWGDSEDYYKQVVEYGENKLGAKVHFLGTRQDVPRLYPDFDIAVHPSLSENLGGAAESLLMGIPTIATNIGGFPDIVKENKTGWLVPPSDPSSLARKIVSVLDHPDNAKKVADFGKQEMLRELDVNNTATQVFDFYKYVMSI